MAKTIHKGQPMRRRLRSHRLSTVHRNWRSILYSDHSTIGTQDNPGFRTGPQVLSKCRIIWIYESGVFRRLRGMLVEYGVLIWRQFLHMPPWCGRNSSQSFVENANYRVQPLE